MEISFATGKNYADPVTYPKPEPVLNNLNVIKISLHKPIQSKNIFSELLSHIILNSFEKFLRKSQNYIVDFLVIGIDVQELGDVTLKRSFLVVHLTC